jgi:hypothetical protein
MKNHLSIELSMGAGGRFSWAGRGGSCSGETRLAECPTVRLVLFCCVSVSVLAGVLAARLFTYVAMLPGAVLPVMSFSQASLHSRTTSMAYLLRISVSRRTNISVLGPCWHCPYFLFLHSPVKANWFSGLPSGIL